MPVLVLDPLPAELEELLERRERWGGGRKDEVWDGVLHMSPEPSTDHQRLVVRLLDVLRPVAESAGMELLMNLMIGEGKQNYRTPDLFVLQPGDDAPLWHPTAALVAEVVSPGDESWKKLPHFAEHEVDEVLIVDPQKRKVDWLGRVGEGYEAIDRSGLIELGPAELADLIDWP